MPKDLVDSTAIFPLPVSVPIDGELATGAAFERPYQQLANRTAYLRDQVDNVGVHRIARAASLPLLKATTGMRPLDVRCVDDFGLYWYDPTFPGSEDLPWRVKPASGVGMWRHYEAAFRTPAGHATYIGTTALVTASTAWIDVPGIAVLLPGAHVNDKLEVSFHGTLGASIGFGLFRLVVNEAASDVPILEAVAGIFAPTAGAPAPRAWTVLYTPSAGGDVTAKLQYRAAGAAGSQAQLFSPVSLTAQLLRP